MINGLPLPEALVAATGDGRWGPEVSDGRLREAFGDDPVRAKLYGLETIAAINETWLAETDSVFLGEPSDVTPPGDLDPRSSLLIGELGPDQLIALDYRQSLSHPTVVYLTAATKAPWRRVSESIDELLERLTGERR